MSYILDALKRAEAERSQGTVPGLHAQPVPMPEAVSSRHGVAAAWPWVLTAVLGVGVAFMGWHLLHPTEPVQPLPGPAAPWVATPSLEAAPTPVPMAGLATPVDAPRREPAVARLQPHAASQPAADAPAAPKPLAAPAVAAASEPTPYKDLPESVRRSLPQLNINGAMYAKDVSQRMLVLNGQVVRQGEKPLPDLVLEEIQAKSAVFNHRGLRYTVSY